MTDADLRPHEARVTSSPRVVRKHNQRRELILRAAAEVFAEVGYHGASLEDIAERLDLTRASLYHYFPSKDALLSTCLEFGAELAIDRLRQVLEDHKDRSAAERLEILIITQLDTILREDPELSSLFLARIDLPDAIKGRVKQLREQHDMCFRQVIKEGVSNGAFAVPDPIIARHCLHGAINYVPVWLRGDDPSFESRARTVAESLVLLMHPVSTQR